MSCSFIFTRYIFVIILFLYLGCNDFVSVERGAEENSCVKERKSASVSMPQFHCWNQYFQLRVKFPSTLFLPFVIISEAEH